MRSAIALSTVAHADGIALGLMPADPCGPYAPAIVEADTTAQASLYALNCGRIPTVAQIVNSYDVANYVPNDPLYHWDQPPPLLPAPVPLDASAGYLIAAMAVMALGGGKKSKHGDNQ